MENFKIENMLKDGFQLKHESLTSSEVNHLMDKIKMEYHISEINKSNFFPKMSHVLKKTTELPTINESKGFQDLCAQLNITLPLQHYIYIIWDYDNVDKIRVCDLKKFWDYIWYGPADEFCLLYIPMTSLLTMIADYGIIYTI